MEEVLGSLFKIDERKPNAMPSAKGSSALRQDARRKVANMKNEVHAAISDAFSNLYKNIAAQKEAAGNSPRKKQTAAGIIEKGFAEFSLFKFVLGQLDKLGSLPGSVQDHLLALYHFLGVEDPDIRKRVDELLRHFLKFGKALHERIGEEAQNEFVERFSGIEKGVMTNAIEFAKIWLDARESTPCAGEPKALHYAHIAAFDFLAAGILRNFPNVTSEDSIKAEVLDRCVDAIPSAPFYSFLSLQLPTSLTDLHAEELPDVAPWEKDAHSASEEYGTVEPNEELSHGRQDNGDPFGEESSLVDEDLHSLLNR